jgi:biotin carboxyl carrier protein
MAQRRGDQVKKTIRFQLDGDTFQVEVERNGDQLTVSREGERYTVELLDTPAAVTSGAPAADSGAPAAGSPPATTAPAAQLHSAGQPGELRAPMTGLIKEVKVAVGSDVNKGDVVLIMEAMKMDVEVSAPATGVVAEIAVRAGDTVESQAPLLMIM